MVVSDHVVMKYGKRMINRPDGKVFHANLIEWIQNCKRIALLSETKNTREFVQTLLPKAEVISFGREDSDVYWDVYHDESSWYATKYDGIVCQAMLEHVTCPFRVFQIMEGMLDTKGILAVHAPAINYKYHAKKNFRDCLRFYKDFFIEISEQLNLKIKELKRVKNHWLVKFIK